MPIRLIPSKPFCYSMSKIEFSYVKTTTTTEEEEENLKFKVLTPVINVCDRWSNAPTHLTFSTHSSLLCLKSIWIYIYIYIEREREREMSSSYIWCNSTNVTPFLDCKFLKNLMFKKKIIKYDCFHLIT